MPYAMTVQETEELGVFTVRVPPEDMVRLRNIGDCSGRDVRGTLEGMLQDAVGMASQVMRATQPEMARAIETLAEANRR